MKRIKKFTEAPISRGDNGDLVFDRTSKFFKTRIFKNLELKSLLKASTKKGLIYSISSTTYTKEVKDILLDLKSSGLNTESVDLMYYMVVDVIKMIVDSHDIDYFIQVPSSSVFLQNIFERLEKDFPEKSPRFISCKQNPISHIHIDKENKDFLNLPQDKQETISNIITKSLQSQINKGRSYFSSRLFPKFVLKFLTGFFTFDLNSDNIRNKNFLVIDDSYSTGTTIKSFIEELSKDVSGNIYGLTFFKFR